MVVWAAEERVLFARSQAVRSRRRARGFPEMSIEEGEGGKEGEVSLELEGRRTRRGERGKAKRTLLVLPLELGDEVVHKSVIEILSSQVSVSGGSLIEKKGSKVSLEKRNEERWRREDVP